MAGVTSDETSSGRVRSMWAEAGLQFRSNLITKLGDCIPLHAHSYDHLSMITYGWFAVREVTVEGDTREYQMASKGYQPKNKEGFMPIGYRTVIKAGHRHEFTLLEEGDQPAEVLCIWPI